MIENAYTDRKIKYAGISVEFVVLTSRQAIDARTQMTRKIKMMKKVS